MDAVITPKGPQNPSRLKSRNSYIRTQILLRILTFLATLSASLVMALNRQARDFGGFYVSASYKSSPAFEFFVAGNAVACCYSLVSLPFLSNSVDGYMMPLLDLMTMGLIMASASAATSIAYLGKKGNADIGWSMVCPYYSKFCERVGISLAFSFLGLLISLIICSLTTIYKTRQIA